MSLRTRMLLAFGVMVLLPLALLAIGLRQEMTRRLSDEYQVRVDRVVEVIREDLHRESTGISQRIASLKTALLNDNRFRLAAVAGVESERNYLLDYAGEAMRLTGLLMLQIQDSDGRIISSGHFRNEHGRLEPALAAALADARSGPVLLTTRTRGSFFRLRVASRFASVAGRSRSSVVSPSTRPFLHAWPVIQRSLCPCSIPEVGFPRIPPRKRHQPRPVTPTPQWARSRFP